MHTHSHMFTVTHRHVHSMHLQPTHKKSTCHCIRLYWINSPSSRWPAWPPGQGRGRILECHRGAASSPAATAASLVSSVCTVGNGGCKHSEILLEKNLYGEIISVCVLMCVYVYVLGGGCMCVYGGGGACVCITVCVVCVCVCCVCVCVCVCMCVCVCEYKHDFVYVSWCICLLMSVSLLHFKTLSLLYNLLNKESEGEKEDKHRRKKNTACTTSVLLYTKSTQQLTSHHLQNQQLFLLSWGFFQNCTLSPTPSPVSACWLHFFLFAPATSPTHKKIPTAPLLSHAFFPIISWKAIIKLTGLLFFF